MVEGDKMALELIREKPEKIDTIFALEPWIKTNESQLKYAVNKTITIAPADLKKISNHKTPNNVLVIVDFLDTKELQISSESDFFLYLDGIQDPGNMGTILRTADWFGVNGVICSNDCVDIYNSKVIQASMGALLRLPVYIQDLKTIQKDFPNLNLYGTVLEGENMYECPIKSPSLVAIGNEGNGIKPSNIPLFTHKIAIPRHPDSSTESLNAGIAAGIVCAFFRQKR